LSAKKISSVELKQAANSAAAKPMERSSVSAARQLLWMPLAVIGAAAFVVEIPFFFFGNPSGHDFEFHLYSWLEVLSQWKQGILFPRWAAMAHFGYGEPRFIFYPPASWILGSLLSVILPWTVSSAVYIWLVLTLAGISMFVLARRWFDQRDAIFIAAFYAVNPYHLVIVYWRSAFAELLASCLVPLLLLCVLKLAELKPSESGRRAIIPLACVLAAAWLTNAPAAIMIHYSVALLVVILAWQQRSFRILWCGAAAVALGGCLASFYLFPAIYEQKWITIAEAVSQGSRPQDNFLFIHTTDTDHDNFNRIVSWVAILEIVLTLALVSFGRVWRKANPTLWKMLAAWGAVCTVLMFPITVPLWHFLPKIAFLQFPWRLLLCLSMVFCIFVAAVMQHWWMRAAIFLAGILVIVAAWHFIQPPWWDNAGDLREMQDNMATHAGYEGTDEYTPIDADPSAINKETINKDADNIAVNGSAHAEIHISEWNAESESFTAEMSAPGQLALHLFRYPAWKVEVNGHTVETSARSDTGQLLVPLDAGMNRVHVTLIRTWDRTTGGWISVITAICIILWTMLGRARIDGVLV
jgi:hypothetical protein